LRWLFFAPGKLNEEKEKEEEKSGRQKAKMEAGTALPLFILLLMLFLRSLAACFDTNIRQHQEYW